MPTVSAVVPPAFYGTGPFTAGNSPDSIASLTLDNGSKVLLVANYGGNSVSVLGSDGNGAFTTLQTLPTQSGPNGFAVGDFGNHHQDFAIANYGSGTISLFLGDGTGNFSDGTILSTGAGPANELAIGDFNRDGRLDLASANQTGGNVSVFLGTGVDTFGPASTYTAGAGSDGVVAGNFLGNGNLDLAVANYGGNSVTLLRNDGTGHFSTASTLNVGANPFYIAVGDFNNDGKTDLATANLSGNSVSILTNLGSGSFSRNDVTAGSLPDAISVGDINGDGNQDLVVSNYSSNNVTELLENGDGTFQAISLPLGSGPNGVILADLNNDGSLDIAVANQNTASASVLLNTAVIGTQGQPLGNVILARFTDSTPQPATDYSALIDWNDGSTADAGVVTDLGNGSYTVTGPSHTYTLTGTYNIQVTVSGQGENTVIVPVTARISPVGSISGSVFHDRNGNGQQGAAETGLGRWTVQLYNSNGQFAGTTPAADDGSFAFAGLAPGAYLVQEVLPTGWTHTAGPSDTVTVPAGGTGTAQLGAFQDITISGTAFSDLNGNGVQDANDPGLTGWTIQLYTEANGQLSATPIETTTTDSLGGYSFSDLGPLAAGTSYAVAEVVPAGWVQDAPSSSGLLLLPDGNYGYVVAATGGVTLADGTLIGGTGSVTLNALNNGTTATITFSDGAGHAGSANAYVSQFTVTYSDSTGVSDSFNTFCIDLAHEVTPGQTTSVYTQSNLTSGFLNASRMAYIYQTYGVQNLSNNPVQAAAVQIALWDLSLNNHNPTSFTQDADGSYSSGDEGVFSVSFPSGVDGVAIAALVDQYLQQSFGTTVESGWLDASAAGIALNRGQSLLLPTQSFNFGNVHFAISGLNVSYGSGTTVTLSGTVIDPVPGGVTVSFSGVVTGSVVTAADGTFSFTTQATGLGTVTAVANDSFGLVSAPAAVQLAVQPPQVGALSVTYGSGTTATITGSVMAPQPGDLTVMFDGMVVGSVTTNADGTFSFTAEASGLGTVNVTTTDAWGQTSNVAQVTLAPTAPQITNFRAVETAQGIWTFSGTVTGENVAGLIVMLGGLTALQGKTATVGADGTFSLSISLIPAESGTATAQTTDPWGQQSNVAMYFVNPT